VVAQQSKRFGGQCGSAGGRYPTHGTSLDTWGNDSVAASACDCSSSRGSRVPCRCASRNDWVFVGAKAGETVSHAPNTAFVDGITQCRLRRPAGKARSAGLELVDDGARCEHLNQRLLAEVWVVTPNRGIPVERAREVQHVVGVDLTELGFCSRNRLVE